ncbi:MAG: hypothetical protein G8237_02810 [Magnetococcales bacterium]|nr:hypothetical protein [Magnetococcales bacterium]
MPGWAWRPATVVAWLAVLTLLAFGATVLDAWWWRGTRTTHATTQQLVGQLLLTDLALFTEARYTRHISQADRHTPFQDHPVALEHFPSGSLVSPVRIPTHMPTDQPDAHTLD